jgi:hypothetical protein
LVHLHSKSPGNERIAQVLGYFRSNRHRVGYADAKARGLPIGSSALAYDGGPRGGQAILELRSLVQSRRFVHAWSLLAKSYRTPVSRPDDVVPLLRANIGDYKQ